MLELGQPIHGYDGDKLAGPIRVRRATEGERLRTLDGVDRALSARGPADHRRLRADRPRRGDGRRDHRALRDHDARGHRGRALRPGVDLPHPEAAQAPLRGVQALRARRRPGAPAVRRGPRRRAAHEVRRRHRRRRASPTSAGRRPRRRSGCPTTCPPASPGWTSTPRPRSRTSRPSAAGCARRTRSSRATPPPWRPDLTDPFDLVEEVARIVGYDRGPVGAADRRPGPRPDPRAAAAPPDRPHAGRCRLRRGGQLPVRRRRRLRRAGAARGRRAAQHRAAGQPAVQRGAVVHDDPAARPAQGGRAQPRSRRGRRRRCSRPAPWRSRPTAVPRRSTASTGGPTDDELAKLLEAIPEQPLHLAVVLAGERERSGWWGQGREADWSDAIDIVRRLGARARRRRRPSSPPPGCPWHPGRCARVSVAGKEFGHAGELHPRVCQAFGLPPRTAAVEIDLDFLMRHARDVVPGPELLDVPGGQGGRRARRGRLGERRGRGGRAARGRRRAARVGAALRRLHRRPGRRRAASRWRSRCASGRPTARSPRRRPAPPATPRSRWPPSGTGAVQRT